MTLIHVVNPNSTASVTARIEHAARRVAGPSTEIVVTTVRSSPVSIEGHADEAMAVPPMLAEIRAAEAKGAAAHVIACFDDPGLSAAREIVAGPVLGICQAAVQVATTLAARFSIITTLPRSVPIVENLVSNYGAGLQCRRVRSVDLPVLTFEAAPTDARRRLLAEAHRALCDDRSEAIVLGCAGMSELADWLAQETGAPVIDGVAAAVKFAEALCGGGFRTSKLGAFAFPRSKLGDLAGVA